MTRKDYQLIASVFAEDIEFYKRDPNNEPDVSIVESTATQMAVALANENPRFDRSRFLSACGVTE